MAWVKVGPIGLRKMSSPITTKWIKLIGVFGTKEGIQRTGWLFPSTPKPRLHETFNKKKETDKLVYDDSPLDIDADSAD